MPLSLVISTVEPFFLQLLYLDFSQDQFGPHLLSEVPGIANFYLSDMQRVKKRGMIGSREKRKGFQA